MHANLSFQTLGKFNHQTFKKGLIQTNAFRKSLIKNASQLRRKESVLTAVLIISIVLAISVMVYVIVVPKEGEKFTEFYVLGPGGMAEEYPIKLLKSFIIISSLWLD